MMKKEKIKFPADFRFEKPELKEFAYNRVARVQGASTTQKRTVTPGFSGGTTFDGFAKPASKR